MEILPSFEINLLNSWIFMIWLLISPFLSNIIIKQKAVKDIIRTSAPMNYEKSLNILSMTAIVIGVIYSFFLPIKTTSIYFYLGLVLFCIAFTLNLTIFLTIRYANTEKPFTKGPYRYSRHPIYLALILMLIGVILMSYSLVILIVLIITGIHLILVMPAEEQYCLKKYGKQYQDYLNRTPQIIGIPKTRNQY